MVEVINKVFIIFSAIYGNLWEKSRDPDTWTTTIELWSDELKKYSPDLIILAAKNTGKYNKDFPPTLPQFIEVIKKYKNDVKPTTIEVMRLEEEKVKSISDLANLEGETTVAKTELAKIRKILSGKLKEISQPIEDRGWDKEKFDRNYRTFDVKYAVERRKYLMSVNDSNSLSLKLVDRADRLRYLAQEKTIWENHV